MSAGPSRGDRPEENPGSMRLVIDLDLGLLPNDPDAELRRTLGFWTAWLPKMDLTQPAEHELRDSDHRVVGTLRLVDASEMGQPEATR
ncbi:MAG: hypothetical protein AVDCRST_MAG02-552 [uncultured Rubrobacteraceae bacterium]|uniref:Uncharacterized protein n=1 Tax=uncultured Rubrobacteraceae bacterium TaxID=349277 RepID=A0A6J4QKN4_9ACTN|nr:MAG: hypothetical protein AVDCRST_MAG02-552 [uncultured Rubrobacteraceae bacterium]